MKQLVLIIRWTLIINLKFPTVFTASFNNNMNFQYIFHLDMLMSCLNKWNQTFFIFIKSCVMLWHFNSTIKLLQFPREKIHHKLCVIFPTLYLLSFNIALTLAICTFWKGVLDHRQSPTSKSILKNKTLGKGGLTFRLNLSLTEAS